MKIEVVIADDHQMVINGVRNMLEGTDVDVVGSYQNGTALLEGLRNRVPDVLLLDIQMPGQSGEALMPLLREQYPDMRIVVLTGFDHIFYIRSMLHLGAIGYLLKSTDKSTILTAIRSAYHHEKFMDPALRQTMEQRQGNTPHIQKPQLTPREKEVLKLVVEGLSSQEIAEKLFLGLRTIKNYRLSLLVKLDAKNTAILVKKALELRLV